MSVHEKMQSDYLWVRNAPVEEGLKVRYIFSHAEITASTILTIAQSTAQNDLRWSTGINEKIIDLWVSSMTGSYKNSDWERNQLIRATNAEDSKTSSDSSKILWATSAGKPTDGPTQLPNFWSMEDFSTGELLSGIGNKFQTNTKRLTKFWRTMERMWREQVEKWKVITTKKCSTLQTWSRDPCALTSSQIWSPSTQLGDRTSVNSCNWQTYTT